MDADQHQYGGFWRRLAALLLDSLVLLPLTAFVLWGSNRFRLFSVYYLLPGTAFSLFYSVYLVRRYGGTPGKLIMGLRIRRLSGESVKYREAFLRYAPEFALGLLMSIALMAPVLHMTDAQYHALSFSERSRHLFDRAPGWFTPVRIFQQIWIWGEFIVLLTNRKRRALHDFIAGTVVVRDGSDQGMQLTAPQSGLPMSVATTFNLRSRPPPAAVADPGVSFGLGRGIVIYRSLIAIRGCWLLTEWLFDWGAYSHVTSYTLTHPYGALFAAGIGVAFWLTILTGMWFFQPWARLILIVVLAVALVGAPFLMRRYSLSSPPSFVPVIAAVMLLLTCAIVAMSFLPPVRRCFTTRWG